MTRIFDMILMMSDRIINSRRVAKIWLDNDIYMWEPFLRQKFNAQ